MSRAELVELAQETIRITEDGYYYKKGIRVILPRNINHYFFSDVVVLSPEKVLEIEQDDEFFVSCIRTSAEAGIYLVDSDSFEAAFELENPLVMNFANALHPGGGFLNGARAQEESLCRNSTLFDSIASNEAVEMYRSNMSNLNPIDSDYMLISPNVCVFRDLKGQLLDEPYNVSVITIPAPDKKGRAKDVEQDLLDKIMKDRIRKMMYVALRYGYRNLVLGAWGCGAFGHSPEKVAMYFYSVLIEEKLYNLFDNIVFAILNDKKKIRIFKEVFGDDIEDIGKIRLNNSLDEPTKVYNQAVCPFPICNHFIGIDKDNLGYAQGILQNGIPFEAELWNNENSRNVSFIVPEIISFEEINDTQDDITGIHYYEETNYDSGVLDIGMVDEGIIDDLDITIEYIQLLKENKLISFFNEIENGAVFLRTDLEGNKLVKIIVALEENGNQMAETDLVFRAFPDRKRRNVFKVIK